MKGLAPHHQVGTTAWPTSLGEDRRGETKGTKGRGVPGRKRVLGPLPDLLPQPGEAMSSSSLDLLHLSGAAPWLPNPCLPAPTRSRPL